MEKGDNVRAAVARYNAHVPSSGSHYATNMLRGFARFLEDAGYIVIDPEQPPTERVLRYVQEWEARSNEQ